jgi:2-desacetyl-2-hydroxyethyl bacteriochlorophyllide A dehydrogenase
LISGSASLAAATAAGMDVRLAPLSPSFPLSDAILAALHCRSGAPRLAQAYLRAKRQVDERARSPAVVDRLVEALAARRSAARDTARGAGVRDTAGEGAGMQNTAGEGGAECRVVNVDTAGEGGAVCRVVNVDTAGEGGAVCRVVDVGAGSLSLLPVVSRAVQAAGYTVLYYDAIDSEAAPLADAADALAANCWERISDAQCGEAAGAALPGYRVALLHRPSVAGSVQVHLEMRCVDVRALASGRAAGMADGGADTLSAPAQPYDLLVASAFADLMSPHALLSTLVRLAPSAVAYLPITFCGRTELNPPSAGGGGLPSDRRVTAAYHSHLRAQGQHFDLPALLDTCSAVGAECLAVEPSDWSIGPSDAFFPYMLDFLSAGTALPLWQDNFSAASWRDSVLARAASFSVGNVDLLLTLPAAPRGGSQPRRALEFSAPREVRVVTAAPAEPRPLSAGQVHLHSLVSMVSSGTELLVYRGQLDFSDQPLDASIPGMDAAPPAYPMEYGYSLVGTVTAVGAGVPLSLVGQTVFAFAPHASQAVIDASCVQRIPPDLESRPADAAFLAAAETAISIAHDAHPRLGETAAVFGAGVIGLLTASALMSAGAAVSVFDPRPDRLGVALALGACRAAPPSEAPAAAFDVTVECSGSPAALQAAVEATADGGRVVVASWYGSKPVSLSLGTRFHRSHMQLVASQVSHIPAAHGHRWNKHRRFGTAWQLIRRVGPARAIPLRTVPLEGAADAYAALDAGEAIACHLTYGEAAGE